MCRQEVHSNKDVNQRNARFVIQSSALFFYSYFCVVVFLLMPWIELAEYVLNKCIMDAHEPQGGDGAPHSPNNWGTDACICSCSTLGNDRPDNGVQRQIYVKYNFQPIEYEPEESYNQPLLEEADPDVTTDACVYYIDL